MKLSFMLKALGCLTVGCHALVLPTSSADLEIEIIIKHGAVEQASSAQSVAVPAKHLDMQQHILEAMPMDIGANVKEITTQAEWDRYLQIPDSLIILFIGAEFAGPSRTITPVYAKLSLGYPDAFFIYADLDDASSIDVVRSVRSVPAFKFYRNGNLITEFAGANPVQLEKTIKANI